MSPIGATLALLLTVSLAFAHPAVRKPRRLSQTVPKQILRPSPLKETASPYQGLLGFADLHCHPASHLAFGANANGIGGIFWGKPGLSLETGAATLATDMPPCATSEGDVSHAGFDADPVRHTTRSKVIQSIDNLTGWYHGIKGYPSFDSWPNSESLSHQQMHILCIRRAYEGGLRLMIASATDNQMLSNLWSKIGFNLLGNTFPPADSNLELASAKRQLTFIQHLADSNSSWMQVVKTPEEAKTAIQNNKLAVILGVELDSLNTNQILDLVKNYGVRQVIPIHLANNPNFGGSAVYVDAFNTNTKYLTGEFFKVEYNPRLHFQLSRPQQLMPGPVGAFEPTDVDDATYRSLAYSSGYGGHVNSYGLNKAEFAKLMDFHLLLDIAHMSDKAAADALSLAESRNYPLMDSHTGLRSEDGSGESERDLTPDMARRLARLGGVIGLGTSAASASRTLADPKGTPLIRFTNNLHEFPCPLTTSPWDADKRIDRIRITFATGDDDLRGGKDNCDVHIKFRSGPEQVFLNVNNGKQWANGSRTTVTLPVKRTSLGDLGSLYLVVHSEPNNVFDSPDNWNLNELEVQAICTKTDTLSTWLSDYSTARQIMGGKGVGLGTDMNGFAPQIPFTAAAVNYPLSPPTASPTGTRRLDRSQLGSKTFDFSRDGLAHYGMLADFVSALGAAQRDQVDATTLMHSANDVVEMWMKVEHPATIQTTRPIPGGIIHHR